MLGAGPLAMADGSTLMIDRSDSITISNALSGAGTIIKRRANTVTYSGVSTFAGTLREDSGTFTVAPGASITGLSVLLQDFNAAGTWNIDGVLSADTYQYGAWVALNNNTRTVTLNVNDGGTATFGSMFLSKIGWANNATAITIINVNAGGTMTATSVMGLVNHPNAGGFRRPHRYINVNGGRLNVSEIDLSQGGDAGTDRRLTIDDGTVANITNGNLTVDSSTEVRLLNSAAVEASAGRTITFSGVVYDTGSLTKTGPGTLALQGTNTYSGSTMVSNGTLLVEGSLSNGTVYVATGGTLGGGGTVHGDTDSDGTVAPGSSAGQLTLDANYTQAAAGTLAIELGGLQPVTEHDRLVVGGTAGLDGQLAVSFIDGFEGSVVIGNVFTVMQAGVISGEFANAPEGSVLAAGGWGVRVNYTANDVVLTVEEEPGGDDDSDGIPNDWELQYSGTTTGVVADADQDGDGILGLDEYILDYDPINTTNLWFAIREMNMGSVDVVFGDTTNSRLYTVDYSSNLASEVWTVLQGPDAGSNGVTTVTDPSEEPLRGYRIRVQTP
jgi:autotransporter-associated beta strand protein